MKELSGQSKTIKSILSRDTSATSKTLKERVSGLKKKRGRKRRSKLATKKQVNYIKGMLIAVNSKKYKKSYPNLTMAKAKKLIDALQPEYKLVLAENKKNSKKVMFKKRKGKKALTHGVFAPRPKSAKPRTILRKAKDLKK